MTDPRSSAGQVPVLPLSGPLERWPDVTTAQARAMLEQALSGLALGPVDQDAAARLSGSGPAGLDPAIAAAVVASWIRGGFEAGLAAGRAEVVDEVAVVQAARDEARALARKLATARATLERVSGWWRDATAERDEAREDLEQTAGAQERYGRVVDEVVAAATDAEPSVEDSTADARAALRVLLVRIERAVTEVAR